MPSKAITSFQGKYFFLSNFYRCTVVYGAHAYRSSEHAYQTEKVRPHGQSAMEIVRKASLPSIAKSLARGYTYMPGWEEQKVQVMLDILRAKFQRYNPSGRPNILSDWLLDTGDAELVEGNHWGDTFWGQCPLGNGQNQLGLLLMQVREELRG